MRDVCASRMGDGIRLSVSFPFPFSLYLYYSGNSKKKQIFSTLDVEEDRDSKESGRNKFVDCARVFDGCGRAGRPQFYRGNYTNNIYAQRIRFL